MSAHRRRCYLGLLVVTVLVGMLLLAACGPSNPLVGRWQDNDTTAVIEFTNDGKIIVSEDGYTMEGTYSISDASSVTISVEGDSITLDFLLSGDTLTLISDMGDTEVMTRIR